MVSQWRPGRYNWSLMNRKRFSCIDMFVLHNIDVILRLWTFIFIVFWIKMIHFESHRQTARFFIGNENWHHAIRTQFFCWNMHQTNTSSLLLFSRQVALRSAVIIIMWETSPLLPFGINSVPQKSNLYCSHRTFEFISFIHRIIFHLQNRRNRLNWLRSPWIVETWLIWRLSLKVVWRYVLSYLSSVHRE